jgi:hypothetical protein
MVIGQSDQFGVLDHNPLQNNMLRVAELAPILTPFPSNPAVGNKRYIETVADVAMCSGSEISLLCSTGANQVTH